MNADDRESSIVFENERWEGQGKKEEPKDGSRTKDHADLSVITTTSPQSFFEGLSWQDSSQSTEARQNSDSDDDFEKEWESLRSGSGTTANDTVGENSFFKETLATHGEGEGELDLFNLKSSSTGEMSNEENSHMGGKENVDLFNFGAPSGNVDLLNMNADSRTSGESVCSSQGRDQDSLGVDLLNLSPSKTKDSQNVDLFSETGHHPMKRNKSADDILADLHDHHDHDFFNQLGSRSSSSSRENIASFTVADESPNAPRTPSKHSETFDPLHPKLSATSDISFDPFSPPKSASSGAFDLFGTDTAEAKTPDPFDPFGVHTTTRGSDSFKAFASGSTGKPQQQGGHDTKRPLSQGGLTSRLPQQQGSNTTGRPVSLGSFSTGLAQPHGISPRPSPQPSPIPSPKPQRAHPDVFGDWGSAESNEVVMGAPPLQPQKAQPKQTMPSQTPNGSVSATKVTDPFAQFGNLKSSLPQFQTPKPAPQAQPFMAGGSGQQTWSKPQQSTWQNRPTPGSPSQTRAKPNYTPSYNPTAGGSVFGAYGLRTTTGKPCINSSIAFCAFFRCKQCKHD